MFHSVKSADLRKCSIARNKHQIIMGKADYTAIRNELKERAEVAKVARLFRKVQRVAKGQGYKLDYVPHGGNNVGREGRHGGKHGYKLSRMVEWSGAWEIVDKVPSLSHFAKRFGVIC
jgi:hypothetical protein